MVTKLRFRRIALSLTLYCVVALAVGFFTYSAYHGSRGIMAKRDYKVKIAALGKNLEILQAERENWERRVRLMQSAALDRDILEERSRQILNSSHKNDVIIILDSKH